MAKYDAAQAASGATSGALTGFALGGPAGAVGGGIVGGALGLFGSKKKKKPKKVSTLDPQQQALYNDYIKGIRGEGGQFNDLYNFDSEGYNNVFNESVAKPAYRNFEENIIPRITGQFTQGNIGNSSYTGEALSRAGRDVQEQLDALRNQNVFQGQQQQQQNRQAGVRDILGMQTFAHTAPGPQQPGAFDQVLGKLGGIGTDWLSNTLQDYSKGGSTSAIPAAAGGTPRSVGNYTSQSLGNFQTSFR